MMHVKVFNETFESLSIEPWSVDVLFDSLMYNLVVFVRRGECGTATLRGSGQMGATGHSGAPAPYRSESHGCGVFKRGDNHLSYAESKLDRKASSFIVPVMQLRDTSVFHRQVEVVQGEVLLLGDRGLDDEIADGSIRRIQGVYGLADLGSAGM